MPNWTCTDCDWTSDSAEDARRHENETDHVTVYSGPDHGDDWYDS
jgi:hypothetical protein